MKYTVLGGGGFIGSHVAVVARSAGHDVWTPGRAVNLEGRDLGHVVYCIGMTADFRRRPFDTIDAHIVCLKEILQKCEFETLTYLSSTRVYQYLVTDEVTEETSLTVNPTQPGDLYNLSKLMGESLLLQHGTNVRVARLSNVLGNDPTSKNFLFCVLRDCVAKNCVELHQSLASAKDYVAVNDVANLLLRLGPEGKSSVYNVASGKNLSHGQLTERIGTLTGATVTVANDAQFYSFPTINIDRVTDEFSFRPVSILDQLPELVERVRNHCRIAA